MPKSLGLTELSVCIFLASSEEEKQSAVLRAGSLQRLRPLCARPEEREPEESALNTAGLRGLQRTPRLPKLTWGNVFIPAAKLSCALAAGRGKILKAQAGLAGRNGV